MSHSFSQTQVARAWAWRDAVALGEDPGQGSIFDLIDDPPAVGVSVLDGLEVAPALVAGARDWASFMDGIDVARLPASTIAKAPEFIRPAIVAARDWALRPQSGHQFRGLFDPAPKVLEHTAYDADLGVASGRKTQTSGRVCCCGSGTCRIGPFIEFRSRS